MLSLICRLRQHLFSNKYPQSPETNDPANTPSLAWFSKSMPTASVVLNDRLAMNSATVKPIPPNIDTPNRFQRVIPAGIEGKACTGKEIGKRENTQCLSDKQSQEDRQRHIDQRRRLDIAERDTGIHKGKQRKDQVILPSDAVCRQCFCNGLIVLSASEWILFNTCICVGVSTAAFLDWRTSV